MKSSSWTDTLHYKRESKEKIEWKEHAVQCLQHVARKQEESNLWFCEDFTELSICSSSPSSDTMPLRLLGVTTVVSPVHQAPHQSVLLQSQQ